MGFSNDRIINAKKLSGVVSNRNYADALAGFENGLNNLIGYSDGTTRPTGVFGGSATNLTKSSNSTNPLENAISLKIARTAAAQGQGYYFDFVPSRNDKLSAATLNIKFFHELISGTFSGSVNPSVDSDLIIGVWDMANNKNIEPKNRLIEPMVSNYVYRYSSNFQIPINATTLRVYIHCATTNSAAFELNLDALEISTINVVNATIRPPVGSIIAHSSTTPPDGYLYCNGQTVSRTQYAKLFSVVGTKYGQGDGSTTFHVPDLRGRFLRGVSNGSGVDPDAASRTAMNTGGATGDNVGSVQADAFQVHGHSVSDPGHSHVITADYVAEGTGVNRYVVEDGGPAVIGPVQIGTNSVATGLSVTTPSSGATSTETRPENANVAYMICYDDGNVQTSGLYSDSIHIACYSLNSDVVANSAILKFDKKLTDTVGAYNPATGLYNCKISGVAKVFLKSFSTSNVTELQIRLDGVNKARGGDGTTANDQSAPVIAAFDVIAGQNIDIFNNTNATFYAGANDNILIIEIEPYVKTTNQNINPHACRYYTTAGQSFSATPQRVNFGTMKYDNAGLVQVGVGVWEFTAKESGVYQSLGNVTRAGTSQNSDFDVKIFYNGNQVDDSYSYLQLSAGNLQYIQRRFHTEDYLLAGQKIWVEIRDPNNGSLSTNAYDNWIAIRKVA